jgi:hypothetical protein
LIEGILTEIAKLLAVAWLRLASGRERRPHGHEVDTCGEDREED